MAKSNKILIILDGSETLENSVNFILSSNFFMYEEINLFFILHPFNPITESQSKDVIYNDFVHDHGRKLANQYLDKVINIINEKNPNIKISVNIVNSKNHIIERLYLGDIVATFISARLNNRLTYIFGLNDLNFFIQSINPIIIIPTALKTNPNANNELFITYPLDISNDSFFELLVDEKNDFLNFQKINFFARNDFQKKELQKVDERISKKYNSEIIENKNSLYKFIKKLDIQNNIMINHSHKIGSLFINSFSNNSISNYLRSDLPVLINRN